MTRESATRHSALPLSERPNPRMHPTKPPTIVVGRDVISGFAADAHFVRSHERRAERAQANKEEGYVAAPGRTVGDSPGADSSPCVRRCRV